MELKSVGIWSCGKIMGAMYFFFGLLFGGMVALMATLGVALPQQQGPGPGNPMGAFAAMGVVAVIVFPIVYGIMGIIAGIISAAIYNLIASLVGGIELQLAPRTEEIQY